MNEHIEQFNDYCAKVMGYRLGYFEGDDVYFTHHGYVLCQKNEYDPYNNEKQVSNVVDELVAKFGIALPDTAGQLYGYQSAARQLILSAIANHPLNDEENLKTSEMVEEKGNKSEEDLRKEFNKHCAEIRGWTLGDGAHNHLYYDSSDEYVADIMNYNPYDSMRALQPALDILKDEYGLVPEGSDIEAARKLIWWWVTFGSECPKKPPHFHCDLDVINLYSTPAPITNFSSGGGLSYDDFNALCEKIVRADSKSRGYNIALSKTFNPYDVADDTLYVLELVINKLPSNITFSISGGDGNGNIDAITTMHEFICMYGLSEEEQFNEMCAGLVEAYDIVDCQPTEHEFFDPYNNTNDLTPIVSIIIETVGVGFTIEAPSVDYDIHNRLRAYAQEYGPEVLDLMAGA